jgi:hypothetical protein
MKKSIRKRKCKHCHEFFFPDYRNLKSQKFCSKPLCRKASKADSQSRWLQKEENINYFKDPCHVKRVQEWRKLHPFYSRKKNSIHPNRELQDLCQQNTNNNQAIKTDLPSFKTSLPSALQDLCSQQSLVLIGLIGQLTGSALQDDIAMTSRKLIRFGKDIINASTHNQGGHLYDQKIPLMSDTGQKTAKTVQLGRSTLDT